MPRKNTSRDEGSKLDELMEEVVELYKTKPLDKVVEEINRTHNLRASKAQYRKRLDRLRVTKNVSQRDALAWIHAGRVIRDRSRRKKTVNVLYNGRSYSKDQAQRVLRRLDAPTLAEKYALNQHVSVHKKSIGPSPERSHIVLVNTSPRHSMPPSLSPELCEYFREIYYASWPSGLTLSMPLPRTMDCLTQTLAYYRASGFFDPRHLARELFLSMPQQDAREPVDAVQNLLRKVTCSDQEAISILKIMAFAIANNIHIGMPSHEVLCDLFHRIRHQKSWLRGLFQSRVAVTNALAHALFASVFRQLDVAVIEDFLDAGADYTYGMTSKVSSLFHAKDSMLVYSLLNKSLLVAKCLYKRGAPWVIAQSPTANPIRDLLGSEAAPWIVEDDVWDFIVQAYPSYYEETQAFLNEDLPYVTNWAVVQRLLGHVCGPTSPEGWRRLILYSTILQGSSICIPNRDNPVTLTHLEESFGVSAIAGALRDASTNGKSETETLQIVKRLLSMGADPNYQDVIGQHCKNPVELAATCNQWSIVELLLDNGASMADAWAAITTMQVSLSEVPRGLLDRAHDLQLWDFRMAVKNGEDPESVRRSLAWDKSLELSCPLEGDFDSHLVYVVDEGYLNYVDVIFRACPALYDCRALMWTVLLFFGEHGGPQHFEIIENILRRRQPGKEPCANEGTALVLAICGGSQQLIRRFSESGVQLHETLKTHDILSEPGSMEGYHTIQMVADFSGMMYNHLARRGCKGADLHFALDWAIFLHGTEGVKYMLDLGLKPAERHMVRAAGSGKVDLLETLIQYGGSVSEPTTYTESCLQRACRFGCLEMVHKLLDLGVAVNDQVGTVKIGGQWYHRTTFQSAVESSNIALYEALIDRGANVNEPAGRVRGATALQLAAGKGWLIIARRLINLGADINAPAGEIHGRTALEVAAEHGRLTMVQFLLHTGVSTTGNERRQYIRAVQLAAKNAYHTIEKVLRDHREWEKRDWQIHEAQTLEYDSGEEDEEYDDENDFSDEDSISSMGEEPDLETGSGSHSLHENFILPIEQVSSVGPHGGDGGMDWVLVEGESNGTTEDSTANNTSGSGRTQPQAPAFEDAVVLYNDPHWSSDWASSSWDDPESVLAPSTSNLSEVDTLGFYMHLVQDGSIESVHELPNGLGGDTGPLFDREDAHIFGTDAYLEVDYGPWSQTFDPTAEASGSGSTDMFSCGECGNVLELCHCIDFSFLDEL